MANYQLLKADIDEKVYQNGRQEITGENLNAVLNAMVTTLGAGYQFAGVATIDTNPGTPDAKVFYIANGKGTYTNFGGLEVTEDEVVVLYWDSSWHKVATGIASQAKLSELESISVNKLAGNNLLPSWIDGGYIETSGNIKVLASFKGVLGITPKIPFNGNNTITLNCAKRYSGTNGYVIYGANDEILATSAYPNANAVQTITNVDGGVSVVLCVNPSIANKMVNYGSEPLEYEPYSPIGGYMNEVNSKIIQLQSEKLDIVLGNNLLKSDEWKDGYYIDTTGNVKSASAFKGITGTTFKIPFNGNSAISLNCAKKYSGTNGYVIYGENDEILATAAYPNANAKQTIANVEGGVAVILCVDATIANKMVNYGATPLEYEPYSPIGGYLNEVTPKSVFVVDKNGDGDYSSLLEGILKATENLDCRVYVKAGVYDLIQEFKSYYGESFFDDYTETSVVKGLLLKNRVKVEFAQGAKVVCNYDGSNANVQYRFSPINGGSNGFELIGCIMESSRVRYAVHDELLQTATPYKNVYKCCRFVHDNTENQYGFRACIGGGLGKYGLIIIEDCEFESKGLTSARDIVSYHNTTADEGKSSVYINGCRFNGYGSFVMKGCGTSPDITTAYVHGNWFEKVGPLPPAIESGYTILNVEMKAWNNTIES